MVRELSTVRWPWKSLSPASESRDRRAQGRDRCTRPAPRSRRPGPCPASPACFPGDVNAPAQSSVVRTTSAARMNRGAGIRDCIPSCRLGFTVDREVSWRPRPSRTSRSSAREHDRGPRFRTLVHPVANVGPEASSSRVREPPPTVRGIHAPGSASRFAASFAVSGPSAYHRTRRPPARCTTPAGPRSGPCRSLTAVGG